MTRGKSRTTRGAISPRGGRALRKPDDHRTLEQRATFQRERCPRRLPAVGRLAGCGRRREAFGLHAANAGTTLGTFTSAREGRILLRRLPTLAEVADVAALMASDRASAMTATIANVTCGEMLD